MKQRSPEEINALAKDILALHKPDKPKKRFSKSNTDNWLIVSSLYAVLEMKKAHCPVGWLSRLNPRILFK